MSNPELFYVEPIYRPPSEGKKSLLLTATVGCAYKCSFCYPYKDKKFTIRKTADIVKDIKNARLIYGPHIERIFFLDGNAFVMKASDLITLAEESYKNHPRLQRVSSYAHAKDILRKSDEELRDIRKSGFNMVYMGIETGDDDILQQINKRITAKEMAEAAQKLHRANITLSGTIILGIAGNNLELSRRHAINTAKLINEMNPPKSMDWYISALTLMIPPGTPLAQEVQAGKFIPMTQVEILGELKEIITNIDNNVHDCIFRSNHASNYLALKGVLSQDKDYFLDSITKSLQDPSRLRPDYLRGL